MKPLIKDGCQFPWMGCLDAILVLNFPLKFPGTHLCLRVERDVMNVNYLVQEDDLLIYS